MVRQKYAMRDPIPMDDGRLTLLRRGEVYYARVRSTVDGRYHWRSLKTSDLQKAKLAARKFRFDAESKEARGLAVSSKPMSAVIDTYVTYRERQHERGQTKAGMLRQIKRTSKFWKEFFGDKRVEAVDDADFQEFVEWRRDYYLERPLPRNAKPVPTDKEIEFNIQVGKSIIKWAMQKGWRDRSITFSYTAEKFRVRPAFDLTDFKKLVQVLDARLRRSKGQRFKESRRLLLFYVMILANSGIRTGEANSLKIRDAESFEDDKGRLNFALHVKGKVRARDAILRAEAAPLVKSWLAIRANASADEPLFAMSDGSRVKFLGDQFKAALKEAGILQDRYGQPYTLYSLRHFYATQAVKHGIDVYRIAKNMGTSVRMIEKYYASSTNSRDFATDLGDITLRKYVTCNGKAITKAARKAKMKRVSKGKV